MKLHARAGLSIILLAGLGTLTLTGASCQMTGSDDLTEATPPPSAGHSLIYHDSLRLVLLVNGGLGSMDDSARSNQPTLIWGWQGRRWIVLDSGGPPIRNLAGVAYDSRRNRLVMHGGSSGRGTTLGETWEWGEGEWVLKSGSGPGPRDHTAMAYDPLRGRSVLFGGQVTPDSFPQETWEWDGQHWVRVATSGPPPRVHHGMQFDQASGRVILFGGVQPNVGSLGDAWSWDGAQWVLLSQDSPRTHLVLAHHGRLGTVVAIGGMGENGAAPFISAWQNGQWAALGGSAPPPRYLAGAAFDPHRNLLVIFGGGNPAGMNLFSDTWEHDGAAWFSRDSR